MANLTPQELKELFILIKWLIGNSSIKNYPLCEKFKNAVSFSSLLSINVSKNILKLEKLFCENHTFIIESNDNHSKYYKFDFQTFIEIFQNLQETNLLILSFTPKGSIFLEKCYVRNEALKSSFKSPIKYVCCHLTGEISDNFDLTVSNIEGNKDNEVSVKFNGNGTDYSPEGKSIPPPKLPSGNNKPVKRNCLKQENFKKKLKLSNIYCNSSSPTESKNFNKVLHVGTPQHPLLPEQIHKS